MTKLFGRLWILLVPALLAAGPARADWYVGADVGATDATSESGFDVLPGSETDDSGFAWSVFGGYGFGPSLALELGYVDLGDDYEARNIFGNGETTKWSAEAVQVALIGRLKVHDRVQLFGRLGVTYWDVELSYREPGFHSSDCDTDVDAVVGGGFEWELGSAFGLRFEWRQLQNLGDEVKTGLPPATGSRLKLNGRDVSVLGVGVTYTFGR